MGVLAAYGGDDGRPLPRPRRRPFLNSPERSRAETMPMSATPASRRRSPCPPLPLGHRCLTPGWLFSNSSCHRRPGVIRAPSAPTGQAAPCGGRRLLGAAGPSDEAARGKGSRRRRSFSLLSSFPVRRGAASADEIGEGRCFEDLGDGVPDVLPQPAQPAGPFQSAGFMGHDADTVDGGERAVHDPDDLGDIDLAGRAWTGRTPLFWPLRLLR